SARGRSRDNDFRSRCPSSGNQPRKLTLSTTRLTFSSQTVGTTSAAQMVTLTNSGTATLTISGISASGDYAQTNTCGASLAAGTNCSLSVTFTPAATGTRTGTVSMQYGCDSSPSECLQTEVSSPGRPPAAAPVIQAPTQTLSQRYGHTSSELQGSGVASWMRHSVLSTLPCAS